MTKNYTCEIANRFTHLEGTSPKELVPLYHSHSFVNFLSLRS